MRTSRLLPGLLALTALCGVGYAGTIQSGSLYYDVSLSSPVAVGDGSEGLSSFTLTITNTTGDAGFNPPAFDGVFFGYTGIVGDLHQHTSPAFAPATPTTDSAQFATAIDTHFLVATGDILAVDGPRETVGVSPSAEASDAPPPFDGFADTGFGDSLTGTFSLTGVGATSWDLAQLVVPFDNYQVNGAGPVLLSMNFFVNGDSGGEAVTLDLTETPEPATLALLSLGAAALLRRRR